MNDERLESLLEEAFKAMGRAPSDVERSTRQVMERKAHVRQRSRWWPFPVLYRRAVTPTATGAPEYRSTPIPATDAHTPIAIGRTQTMFSPAKTSIVGALVFALGGALLIAQPFGQQQGSPLGAETGAIAPTWVTGSVQPASSCSGPESELDGDVRRDRNIECSPQRWTSSDPRLTGEVVRRWNLDVYETEEGSISVGMDAAYLRNDRGDWACSNSYLLKGAGSMAPDVTRGTNLFHCVGEGGYAGLSAVLVLEAAGGFSEEFVGLIFSGDLPPLPEPPAAE